MTLKPAKQKKTIVILGSFNPSIFQPRWMAKEGLIPNSEGESAQIDVLQQEFSGINFGTYQLVVTLDRFQLSTQHVPFYPVIRDLAIGIFRLLRHTPLTKLGINSEEHYQLKDSAEWHRFGHLVAPKEGIWDTLLLQPGMRSLTIEGLRPGDSGNGVARLTVAPVGDESMHTVAIGLNDEFQAQPAAREPLVADDIVTLLETNWELSEQLFRKSVAHLIGLATSR